MDYDEVEYEAGERLFVNARFFKLRMSKTSRCNKGIILVLRVLSDI